MTREHLQDPDADWDRESDTGCDRAAPAERIARAFHDAYESSAPLYGYATREASAKPWGDVPENNRRLMIATVTRLLNDGTIVAGQPSADPQNDLGYYISQSTSDDG